MPFVPEDLQTLSADELIRRRVAWEKEYDTLCRELQRLLLDSEARTPQDLETVEYLLAQSHTLLPVLRQYYLYVNDRVALRKLATHEKLWHALKPRPSTLTPPTSPHTDTLQAPDAEPETTPLLQAEESSESLEDDSLIETLEAGKKNIRSSTTLANSIRGFTIRTSRFMESISNLLEKTTSAASTYISAQRPVTQTINTLNGFFSWIFLLPRLVHHITLTLWHTISHRHLAPAEKTLSWRQRLRLQWQERWAEILSDSVIVIGGILCCFVLVGTLGMVGVGVGFALIAWDIFTTSLSNGFKLNQLNALETEYTKRLATATTDSEKVFYETHLEQLKVQQSYQQKRCAISAINFALSTVLAICIFLFGNTSPIFMVVASTLVLALAVGAWRANRWAKKNMPPAFELTDELHLTLTSQYQQLHTLQPGNSLKEQPTEQLIAQPAEQLTDQPTAPNADHFHTHEEGDMPVPTSIPTPTPKSH